ncbi:MAG: hypothetical protein ACOX3E_08905 [Desulfomonilia bacterium]|uniref:Uncharacterized protein n=1 Tax=anaerobic digester metagenome TaxID=1263854 RepID=A0A485M3X6_9ZZZZ|nr:hypothetical protein [Pseudomonadota bacterium]HPD20180.1 hypothetical protein [Deltaproteobacteria bacterium]HPX17966.1 hypothetical protein [Deltaproteobacteria bacterium]HRS54848.1 hypothetical protein [Desulfomonilia bacterium]HRV34397.1 hypothetical protein [Desulfomonilia bacterium]
MEVKNIFVNFIMKSYEKQDAPKVTNSQQAVSEKEPVQDVVAISPQASRRLFGELMEHSLKKGLSGVCADEN